MAKKDPRVDAYIAKSAAFAQPILKHLRKLAHATVPNVEETLKWGMPHFIHQGTLFGMAAFKAHCALVFWKAKLIFAEERKRGVNGMGHFGRITSLADLPSNKILVGYIKEAVRLNEAGVKLPPKPRATARKELVVPAFFIAAVRKNKKAWTAFEAFSHSHKKEYVQWVTEAKGEDTRQRRLDTTVGWLAQGKSRNWKYEKC